jgi:hypothetical protein
VAAEDTDLELSREERGESELTRIDGSFGAYDGRVCYREGLPS